LNFLSSKDIIEITLMQEVKTLYVSELVSLDEW
jgi:hypothetical protein